MAFTQTITQETVSGGAVIRNSKNYTGGGRVSLDEPVADSVTDQLHNLAIDVSEVVSCYIVASVAMLLETNAIDATGGNTLNLIAGVPYVFTSDSLDSFLLTLDVTKIYMTNASGAAGTIKLEIVYDPTP